MVYVIWCEGYQASPDYGTAHMMGVCDGNSFKEACVAFMEKNPEHKSYYNEERNTYWGCGLFDNEGDARKNFG